MKRLLTALLAVMMLCSFVNFAVAEEPMVLTFFLQEHPQSILNNDIYTFKTIGEKFNIEFDFQLTPYDVIGEKVNMILAGNNYPDIMVASATDMAQYYDTGIFVELTDLVPEKIPNFLAAAEKTNANMVKNLKDDEGRLWYLTKIEYSNYNLFPHLNGDWLEEVGMDMPTTIDELYDVLTAFKKLKGDDAIIWASGPWTGNAPWKYFIQYFGANYKWMHEAEGTYVYAPYERADKLKVALETMKKWLDEGLLETDWLSRDDDSINAKINAGEVGFFITYGDNGNTWGKGGTAGTNYVMPGPFASEFGDPYVEPNTLIANNYFIMNNGDQAKLDKICEVMNYIYSDEGADLFSFGEEGVTYTRDADGKPVFTDTILKHELGGVNGRRQMGINPNPFPHVSLDEAWGQLVGDISKQCLEAHKLSWDLPAPVLTPTTDEALEQTQLYADIDKYVRTSIVQFITGELSLENDWDKFIETQKDLGVERYIELVQAQYQRWLAR